MRKKKNEEGMKLLPVSVERRRWRVCKNERVLHLGNLVEDFAGDFPGCGRGCLGSKLTYIYIYIYIYVKLTDIVINH